MESQTGFHPQLLRILKRSNFYAERNLNKAEMDFLERISRTFYDYDRDRYLLERSMQVSSLEMSELNAKLAAAQKIAHLGYWSYKRATDSLTWSEEMYPLTGFDPAKGAPKMKLLVGNIH